MKLRRLWYLPIVLIFFSFFTYAVGYNPTYTDIDLAKMLIDFVALVIHKIVTTYSLALLSMMILGIFFGFLYKMLGIGERF